MAWSKVGIWLLFWGLSAQSAEAGEVTLGGETRVGYDSNVFNRDSKDPAGDIESAIFLFRLDAGIEDELERGSYQASYVPTAIVHTEKDAGVSWNHNANVEGRYNFSPRTSVTVRDQFNWQEKPTFGPDDPDPDPNVDESGNRRTARNTASVFLTHLLTQRWSTFTGGDYTIYRYSRARDNENDSFSGFLGTDYAFTRQLRLGIGGNGSYRSFEGEPAPNAILPTVPPIQACFGEKSPRSRTYSYSGFASVAYQLDPTMSLQVRAGPARIESTSYQCLPPGIFYRKQDGGQTTWFAQGELLKNWQFVKTSVRYRRQEGTGGATATTVNDSLIARADWRISQFWNAGVRGSWIRRNSKFTTGRNADTTTWTAAAKVGYQVLRRLRLTADVSYRNQTENNSRAAGASRDFEVWRAFLGVRYQLDPLTY